MTTSTNAHDMPADAGAPAVIDYTNWRGERSMRNISPGPSWWGTAEPWHKTPGWLMAAVDRDTGKMRIFALAGIHTWNGKSVAYPAAPKTSVPGNDAGMRGDDLALEYLVGTMERAMACGRSGCDVFYIPPAGHGSGNELLAKLKERVAARAAFSPPTGSAGDDETGVRELLGRFDHHPDPAIDFCIEVEVIEGMHYDHKVGANDGVELAERVARAMTFRVGGDEIAVRAKHALRGIEAALAPTARAGDGVDAHTRRVQALGAALSRRDWHAADVAHAAIRDAR